MKRPMILLAAMMTLVIAWPFFSLADAAIIDYRFDEAYVSAVQFLRDAGISATVTKAGADEDYLHFSLEKGGTARYYHFSDGYDRYGLTWHFFDASDEDIDKYVDANLRIAAEVEQGLAPEEWLKRDYQGDLGLKNINATISNMLSCMEGLGQQALDAVMNKLAAHDGDDVLNSLRARLASRLLGDLDNTGVDPALGCAWYDALVLRVQDALPPVDASTYVDDPLICQLTQEMIVYEDERKDGWKGGTGVDDSKTRTLACLKVNKLEEKNDALTVWAGVWESTFALYDGTLATEVSGSTVPSRLTFMKDENGAWKLSEVVEAEDGDYYPSSILRMCGGDEELARRQMDLSGVNLGDCFIRYCAANGFPSARFEQEE